MILHWWEPCLLCHNIYIMKKYLPLLLFFVASSVAAAPSATLHSIAITVSDLERSVEFYTRVLSFNKLGEREIAGEPYERLTGVYGLRARAALLTLGDEQLILVQYLTPGGKPLPLDSKPNDRWFQHLAIAVSDMDKGYQWVHDRRAGFISPNPQKGDDGVKTFYFRDPDGHALALIGYPEGKGNPKWHRENRAQKIFLGIDHTALTVASLEKSLRFYRDVLGLKVRDTGEREGVEQSRLDGLAGSQVKFTQLESGSGLRMELIEYVAPAGGRVFPADAKTNDLIHWQNQFVTEGAGAMTEALVKAGVTFISEGSVTFPERELRISGAALVRDPDGHALALVEK